MSLDGVIDAPTWTFEYGFDPKMGEAISAFTEGSEGILLGRNTYEMFEPAWSTRTEEDDPGAPFFNDTTKYVVSGTLTEAPWRNSEIVGPYGRGTPAPPGPAPPPPPPAGQDAGAAPRPTPGGGAPRRGQAGSRRRAGSNP